jgi:hypothetical protein
MQRKSQLAPSSSGENVFAEAPGNRMDGVDDGMILTTALETACTEPAVQLVVV